MTCATETKPIPFAYPRTPSQRFLRTQFRQFDRSAASIRINDLRINTEFVSRTAKRRFRVLHR